MVKGRSLFINGRKQVIEIISVPQFSSFSFQVVWKLLLALFNLAVVSFLLLVLWIRVLRLCLTLTLFVLIKY